MATWKSIGEPAWGRVRVVADDGREGLADVRRPNGVGHTMYGVVYIEQGDRDQNGTFIGTPTRMVIDPHPQF